MNDKVIISNHHCHDNMCRCFRNKTTSRNLKSLRKVISSKKLCQGSTGDGKSYSTGVINQQNKMKLSKPKLTAKSDLNFGKNLQKNCRMSELCLQCGDTVRKMESGMEQIRKNMGTDNHSHTTQPKCISIASQKPNARNLSSGECAYKTVQQYYRNENFAHSSESVHAFNSRNKLKASLSTINETAEETGAEEMELDSLKDVLYEIYPEATPEEMGYFDIENNNSIKQIEEFRQNNYFECHSAKSRVAFNTSTRLGGHKCVYRFYLNERLFPVPLNTDHHNNVRCIDCHLPVGKTKETSSCNGTIQAKVKLGDETQDMILMLPVKEPLIIKEKRKELQSVVNPEVLYFGIIKLNPNGDSLFNSTRPSNSLALKYQKGYKEFVNKDSYKYECAENGDVIII